MSPNLIDKMRKLQMEEELLFRTYEDGGIAKTIPVPISLTPAVLPQSLYERAKALVPIYNDVVRKMVNRVKFLDDVCQSLLGDEFVHNLYKIWTSARGIRHLHDIKMNFIRSDYMIHMAEDNRLELKQVELNTISISFAHLSSQLSKSYHSLHSDRPALRKTIVHNASRDLCEVFLQALDYFDRLYGTESVAIMVVAPHEANFYDQQGIIDQMRGRMRRMTFMEIKKCCRFQEDYMCLEEGKVVGLVYYRTGYDPKDYMSEIDVWAIRQAIEMSTAIKEPDIGSHLAGLKKVQQELTRTGAVEQFVGDENGKMLRETFMEILSLADDQEGNTNANMAISDCSKWVLKPQREGGGNNTYTYDIPALMTTISSRERANYILMELIRAPINAGRLIRNDQLEEVEVVHEFGLFGVYLVVDGVEITNKYIGYLVRTKQAQVNEGGVVAGYSCLNSLSIDSSDFEQSSGGGA